MSQARSTHSGVDAAIVCLDRALRTLFAPAVARRRSPAAGAPEAHLDDAERRHSAALMRVNHVGEVCAQALYQGQALASTDDALRATLSEAAAEEADHLAWTEQRLVELGGRKSLLNPMWYGGAFALGLVAGRLGERWSLGFLSETERQVETHLKGHLETLPEGDLPSRAIVAQMKSDEVRHADMADAMGAHVVPPPVQSLMRLAARVMTVTAYRV